MDVAISRGQRAIFDMTLNYFGLNAKIVFTRNERSLPGVPAGGYTYKIATKMTFFIQLFTPCY